MNRSVDKTAKLWNINSPRNCYAEFNSRVRSVAINEGFLILVVRMAYFKFNAAQDDTNK